EHPALLAGAGVVPGVTVRGVVDREVAGGSGSNVAGPHRIHAPRDRHPGSAAPLMNRWYAGRRRGPTQPGLPVRTTGPARGRIRAQPSSPPDGPSPPIRR